MTHYLRHESGFERFELKTFVRSCTLTPRELATSGKHLEPYKWCAFVSLK